MPVDYCHRYNESEPADPLCSEDVDRISLCEVLDRVLNKGIVIAGHVTISVADVDLLYLGLQVVLTSMGTARNSIEEGNRKRSLALNL